MPNLRQAPCSKLPSSRPSPPPSRMMPNDTNVTGISYQNVGNGATRAAPFRLKSTIYCGRRRADHNIPSLAGLAPFSPVACTPPLVVCSHRTPNIMHSRQSRHCRRHTQGWVFSRMKPTPHSSSSSSSSSNPRRAPRSGHWGLEFGHCLELAHCDLGFPVHRVHHVPAAWCKIPNKQNAKAAAKRGGGPRSGQEGSSCFMTFEGGRRQSAAANLGRGRCRRRPPEGPPLVALQRAWHWARGP